MNESETRNESAYRSFKEWSLLGTPFKMRRGTFPLRSFRLRKYVDNVTCTITRWIEKSPNEKYLS